MMCTIWHHVIKFQQIPFNGFIGVAVSTWDGLFCGGVDRKKCVYRKIMLIEVILKIAFPHFLSRYAVQSELNVIYIIRRVFYWMVAQLQIYGDEAQNSPSRIQGKHSIKLL